MDDALPTVFKWEGGGKEVSIAGTFSDWKPIKMCSSHGDFVTIINVPEVPHEIVQNARISNTSFTRESTNTNLLSMVRKLSTITVLKTNQMKRM